MGLATLYRDFMASMRHEWNIPITSLKLALRLENNDELLEAISQEQKTFSAIFDKRSDYHDLSDEEARVLYRQHQLELKESAVHFLSLIQRIFAEDHSELTI